LQSAKEFKQKTKNATGITLVVFCEVIFNVIAYFFPLCNWWLLIDALQCFKNKSYWLVLDVGGGK